MRVDTKTCNVDTTRTPVSSAEFAYTPIVSGCFGPRKFFLVSQQQGRQCRSEQTSIRSVQFATAAILFESRNTTAAQLLPRNNNIVSPKVSQHIRGTDLGRSCQRRSAIRSKLLKLELFKPWSCIPNKTCTNSFFPIILIAYLWIAWTPRTGRPKITSSIPYWTFTTIRCPSESYHIVSKTRDDVSSFQWLLLLGRLRECPWYLHQRRTCNFHPEQQQCSCPNKGSTRFHCSIWRSWSSFVYAQVFFVRSRRNERRPCLCSINCPRLAHAFCYGWTQHPSKLSWKDSERGPYGTEPNLQQTKLRFDEHFHEHIDGIGRRNGTPPPDVFQQHPHFAPALTRTTTSIGISGTELPHRFIERTQFQETARYFFRWWGIGCLSDSCQPWRFQRRAREQWQRLLRRIREEAQLTKFEQIDHQTSRTKQTVSMPWSLHWIPPHVVSYTHPWHNYHQSHTFHLEVFDDGNGSPSVQPFYCLLISIFIGFNRYPPTIQFYSFNISYQQTKQKLQYKNENF